MALSPENLELVEAFRTVVRQEVQLALSGEHPAARIESMNVEEFAHVVHLSSEVVLRKIRSRIIPGQFVSKKAKPFRISPDALDLFQVKKPEAAARLAEYRLGRAARSGQPSPV